jgi:hypothetical protein
MFAQYTAVDVSPATNSVRYYVHGGTSGQQVGTLQSTQLGAANHALLLTGNGSTVVDLHPTSLPPDSPYYTVPNALVNTPSVAYSSDGASQAGQFINTAVLWTGTQDSMVNLHPAQYNASSALAVRGLQQAGWATTTAANGGHRGVPQSFYTSHAILWQGSASNFVDLHPAGFDGSAATSLSGGLQAGYGITNNNSTQALMWSGSAGSVVNLHPQAFTSSVANGVNNGLVVGTGTLTKSGKAITSIDHAVLWFGSAKSCVDLNPAGFTSSDGMAINNTKQVGYGLATDATGTHYHALVWTNTAASVVDLNQFLPAGYTDATALAIDAAGNIVGNASAADHIQHPIVWIAQ